jgi:hypothetical protein
MEFSRALADGEARRIGLDVVEFDGKVAEVSTMDVLLESPGGHYETRVTVDDQAWMFRYRDREAAHRGHAEIVTRLRSGRPDPLGLPE